jgi:hypothetical protein
LDLTTKHAEHAKVGDWLKAVFGFAEVIKIRESLRPFGEKKGYFKYLRKHFFPKEGRVTRRSAVVSQRAAEEKG